MLLIDSSILNFKMSKHSLILFFIIQSTYSNSMKVLFLPTIKSNGDLAFFVLV